MTKVIRRKTVHVKSPITRKGRIRVLDIEKVFKFPVIEYNESLLATEHGDYFPPTSVLKELERKGVAFKPW